MLIPVNLSLFTILLIPYLWSIDVTIIHIFLKCSKHAWGGLLFEFFSNLSLNKQSKDNRLNNYTMFILFCIILYSVTTSGSENTTVFYFPWQLSQVVISSYNNHRVVVIVYRTVILCALTRLLFQSPPKSPYLLTLSCSLA